MDSSHSSTPVLRPSPLPYQADLVRYLKAEEPGLWKWFAAEKRTGQAEALRLDLLKTTYRLEPAGQPKLYALAQEVAQQFGVQAPITFYQTQTGQGLNAALAYLPDEVHLILSGPIATVLSEAELRALLGHELAHFLLFQEWDGDYRVATDLLNAVCNDPQATPVHHESARLFRLYSEVFADQGAWLVVKDLQAAIAALIKVQTGLAEVSAESYLRQADEIFSKSKVHADQLTHPESYIRARALKLWADHGAAQALAEIARMIEGALAFDRLDLLGQAKVAQTTRQWLHHFLTPAWLRTESILSHARRFFEDFAFAHADLPALGKDTDPVLRDYYCYVLLDFVTVDRDLTEEALAAAVLLCRGLGWEGRFGEIVVKELGLTKKALAKVERDAEATVAQANKMGSNA